MASSPKAGGDGGSHLPAELESRAARARPLDASVRGPMERSFGASLGDVVVHTDADAAASADRLDAKAYAVGRHVVFGPGRYDPHSDAGRALIGHELAHVVQQRRGGVAPGPGGVHPSGTAAEGAAHRAGARAAAGLSAPVAGGTAPGVSRAPKGEEDPEAAALKADNRAADLRNLGVAEGIVLEGAAIVDTVVGFRYSVQDLEQRGVDNLASALGLGAEGKARLQVASDLLTGADVLRAVRDKAKAAGLVDPVTGSPAISSQVTAAGDWLEAKYDENLGTRAPKNDDLFTDRELGQIIGQLTAKTVLTAIDVEEVAVALAAVNVIGAVKSILDAVNANPDGWPSDVQFWTQVVAAVLTLAGMRAGSANKKIAMLLIDAALAGLTLAPVVKRLVTDWRRPAGADRDAALKQDAKDLAKALLALLHQILLQAAASRRAKSGGGPPAAGAASGAAKTGPTSAKQPASHGEPHAGTPAQPAHTPLESPAPPSPAHAGAPATPAVPAAAPKAAAAKPAAKKGTTKKPTGQGPSAKGAASKTTAGAATPAAATAAIPDPANAAPAQASPHAKAVKPEAAKSKAAKSKAAKPEAAAEKTTVAKTTDAPAGGQSGSAPVTAAPTPVHKTTPKSGSAAKKATAAKMKAATKEKAAAKKAATKEAAAAKKAAAKEAAAAKKAAAKEAAAAKKAAEGKGQWAYDRSGLSLSSRRWSKRSQEVRAAHPVCEMCQIRPSAAADHLTALKDWEAAMGAGIVTREQARAAANDPSNLAGICTPCNSGKQDRPLGNPQILPGAWEPPNPTPRVLRMMRDQGTQW
ncbi:eCIS core domain-containing protein [Embleya sp. NPDC001921]